MDVVRHGALRALRASGLRVVEGQEGPGGSIDFASLHPEQDYYIRSLDSPAISKIVPGTAVAAEVAAHDEDLAWVIQPFLLMRFGGAALSGPELLHVEAVSGSPMGLLRGGELALASTLRSGDTAVRTRKQADEWDASAGKMRPLASVDPSLADVVGLVESNLVDSQSRGLFEWGFAAGQVYFLDHKEVPPELLGLIEDGPRPAEPASSKAYEGRLPSLATPYEDLDTDLILAGGARLAHAVARRCASGVRNVYFEGW